MKRKGLYLLVACITLGLGITVASMLLFSVRHASGFMLVSEDGVGGGGFGAGKRGLGVSMKTWESSDGVKVYEDTVAYASVEDARKDFEEELKGAETIIKRRDGSLMSDVDESVIAVFVNPESKERTIRVIKLKNTDIYHAAAPSNNAMQPTAHRLAFIRKTPFLPWPCAAADGGR